MELKYLINELSAIYHEHGNCDVLFDSEAGRFKTHMVEISTVHHQNEPASMVSLHTNDPIEHGTGCDVCHKPEDVKLCKKHMEEYNNKLLKGWENS